MLNWNARILHVISLSISLLYKKIKFNLFSLVSSEIIQILKVKNLKLDDFKPYAIKNRNEKLEETCGGKLTEKNLNRITLK